MTIDDYIHLRAAFDAAREARANGNAPFGAVLVDAEGNAVLQAGNTVATSGDITGHAETNLVRLATPRYSAEQLATFTLYASAEPCAMCAGAIHWANIGRVVYGISAEAFYALVGSSSHDLVLGIRAFFEHTERPIEIVGPLLEDEAKQVHLEDA